MTVEVAFGVRRVVSWQFSTSEGASGTITIGVLSAQIEAQVEEARAVLASAHKAFLSSLKLRLGKLFRPSPSPSKARNPWRDAHAIASRQISSRHGPH